MFNAHCQEWVRHTVWSEDCRSWYKNNETGRVNAIWPGSSLHYIQAIKHPRYEDFEIDHLGPAKRNMWAFLGMGTVREMAEKADLSSYLSINNIDPDWAKAVGLNTDKILEKKLEQFRADVVGQGEKKEAPLLDEKTGEDKPSWGRPSRL